MTALHSAEGQTRNLRERVTSPQRLHHNGLSQVHAELATQATNDPPTFRELAADIGWPAAADRVNAWAAGGYEGDWWEGRYGRPAPRTAGGAA